MDDTYFSSFADFTNRRVQAAKTPLQSPGNLNFGRNSGRFSVPKDPNVKSDSTEKTPF